MRVVSSSLPRVDYTREGGPGPRRVSATAVTAVAVQPAQPVFGAAGPNSHTREQHHQGKVAAAWSLLLSPRRNDEGIDFFESRPGQIRIRGALAASPEGAPLSSFDRFDNRRGFSQTSQFPLTPTAEHLIQLLNAYHASRSTGVGAWLKRLRDTIGLTEESHLPEGKRTGTLQSSAFIERVDSKGVLCGERYCNEKELKVEAGASVASGTERKLAAMFGKSDIQALVKTLQDSSQAGGHEVIRVSTWVPATIAEQLLRLPKETADALVILAELRAQALNPKEHAAHEQAHILNLLHV